MGPKANLGRVPEVGVLLPQIGDFALRLAFDAVVVAPGRLGLVLALLPEQQPADEEEHGDRVGEVEGVPGQVPRPVFRCRETARAQKRVRESVTEKRCTQSLTHDSRKKVHVAMRPPQLPANTVVPIEAARAVSVVTFAADQAVHSAPKLKHPSATKNAAV